MSLEPALVATLEKITTATITTMLLKKGIRRCWMSGPMPFSGDTKKRIVGRAFTLRFVPVREDLATPASWAAPISTRGAIEGDAGRRDRGRGRDGRHDRRHLRRYPVHADVRRGVKALVTDGVVRDKTGVVATGLPTWCRGTAAPASVNGSPSSAGRSRSHAAASPCSPTT